MAMLITHQTTMKTISIFHWQIHTFATPVQNGQSCQWASGRLKLHRSPILRTVHPEPWRSDSACRIRRPGRLAGLALQAERQEAQPSGQRAVSTILLAKALGGGWQPGPMAKNNASEDR